MSCHVCRGGPTWAYAKVRFTGRDARPSALAHAQARARGAHHRASRRGQEEVRVRRPVRPVRGEGGRLDAGGEPRADLPVRSRQLLRGVRLASDLLQGVQREAPGRRGGGVLRAALLLPDEGRRAAPRAGGGGAVLLRRARPRPTRSQDGAVVMSIRGGVCPSSTPLRMVHDSCAHRSLISQIRFMYIFVGVQKHESLADVYIGIHHP